MKKIYLLFVAVVLVFTAAGCQTEVEELHLKVMAPLGSPALAQTYMEYELPIIGEHVTYEVDTVSGTDPLVAAFTSGSHDIIYAPTNLGAKLYSTGIDYEFAGTVVWGNLFLATGTDEEFTLADLDGKEIIAFGQNATPDIILQTILADQEYETPPTITYKASVGEANAELAVDNSKIVLLAEPVLSVIGLNIENMKTISLQDAWSDLTGSDSYPQAGIFVKKDVSDEVLIAYLNEVRISIDQANTNPAEVAAMAVTLEYGFPEAVLTTAIPRSSLLFKNADDSKDALETYFEYILDFNPALIGESLPEDSFYR